MGRGGVGWGRLEAGLEVPKETEMLDPAVGMRASGCLGRARGCSKPSFLAQDIKSGRSPLIHAVENNSLSMVQLLLQVGTAPSRGLSPTRSSGPDRLSLHPCHRPLLLPVRALRLLCFQPRPFLLGLLPPTLGLHSFRLRTSPRSSRIPSSKPPKRSRPRPARVSLTLVFRLWPSPGAVFPP